MKSVTKGILAAALLSAGAMAQEAAPAAEAPAAPQAAQQGAPATSVARQQAQPQPDYVRSTHEDWAIKCTPGQIQQCYMSQLILGPNQSPLMNVEFVPANIEGEPDAILGGTVIAPLNVFLPRGIYFQVDEQDPDLKEFQFCNQVGCVSRFAITQANVDTYKAAGRMFMVIFPMANPQQGVEVDLSLMGFTAAFDELMAIEAEEKAKAAAASN